jgi:hypothetical protein
MWSIETWVVRQDGLLQTLQLWTRLKPELTEEPAAGVGIRVERFGLAAGAVKGKHQLSAKTLAVRMGSNEFTQLRNQLPVTT